MIFNQIPAGLRIPFAAVEFDSSKSTQGPALKPYRTLLIGQKLAAGSQAADSLALVSSAAQVAALAGLGSMLHRMALAYFADNTFTETWIGVLGDNVAGVAPTGTLTVTGPESGAGTLQIYIGGELVSVAVASGDAATAIATAIAAAITAIADLPVTAAAVGAVVTLTHRHKGTIGNGLDVRLNYQIGNAIPAGVAVAIVAMNGGTTDPTLTNLIAAMGDTWFDVVAMPYTDATSLTAIENELERRFGPMVMADGAVITAANGSQATMATLGNGRNSKQSCIVATNNSPTPVPEYAANIAALVAFYGNIDPARPFQTLASSWILPPAQSDQFTLSQRNILLQDGISTTKAVAGGVVQIERMITTYKTNSAGAADTSYLDLTTRLTLSYLRYSFRTRMLTRYPRHKLADDGVPTGQGQAIITPKIGKAEAINWFRDMVDLGLVEQPDQFKNDLVVQRNQQNVNQLDFLLPPNVINFLLVTAAQIQFRL